VRHGACTHPGPATIEIAADVADDRLQLVVSDDGPGPGATSSDTGGLGLSTTRERLHRTYGATAALHLGQGAGRGTRAVLEMPLARTQEQPEEPACRSG
jgi:LytS/YehU family sensor histidine kinase